MQDVFSLEAPAGRGRRLRRVAARARALAPTRVEALLAAASTLLLVLSFPDFDLWPLAWVGLVPVTVAVVRAPMSGARALVLGWAFGTVFFYSTCYWLSHAIIHYGGFPPPLAYLLIVPGAIAVGFFPGLWAFALARLAARRGAGWALLLSPFAWAALEWARLGATGQLWNAVGYSQAYAPALIQTARWGGVYMVGFLVLCVNAALAHLFMKRSVRAALTSAAAVAAVVAVILVGARPDAEAAGVSTPSAVVVGVQPNVAVERTTEETARLMSQHLSLASEELRGWGRTRAQASPAPEGAAAAEGARGGEGAGRPARVVVWPESPMNFRYARDASFREFVAGFARAERASVIFNALEPAPAGGYHNSAVMVNEEGRLVAQYDKIRLLPFGEYVPLPRWLPPAWLLEGIAGDFTPGADYPLMPMGDARAGVFICFESAFPSIPRRFARDGADVMINISNDGYLGRTPVIRQHLANVVFRAVEAGRPVLRVTNTGVSALVTPRGEVRDATLPFEQAARSWEVSRAAGGLTFYARWGDAFAALCSAVTACALLSTFGPRRRKPKEGA